jgi:HD-GYP domain-containing protein (c-di-GMP phosphodiesterase class II)
MYQVRKDSKKNRLYLTFAEPSRQELRKALKEVEKLCLTLQPNFTCVTDLRGCVPIIEENKDLFEKKQNRIWGLGVGKTVRVIPESDSSLNLVQSLRSIAVQYQTDYVTSIQEAETILDTYKEEIDRHKSPVENEMFKIIDMDGWEFEKCYLTYDEAFKNLKKIRKTGRQTAIVVGANVSVCNNLKKARQEK